MDANGDVSTFVMILAINAVLFFVFFWSWVRILHRMGLSGWWALTMWIWPIALPILATCRWPAFDAALEKCRKQSA